MKTQLAVSVSDDIPISKRIGAYLLIVTMIGSFVLSTQGATAVAYAPTEDTQSLEAHTLDKKAQSEILWLARALYSESKRPGEQFVIGWVIRNRVEATRFPDTYKEVVLERKQFSGLQKGDAQYDINMSRTYEHTGRGWDTALHVADLVYHADGTERPVSEDTYHFYSPHAVHKTPTWASGEEPVKVIQDPTTYTKRFAFYANIK